jgi:hypothetical protein
VRGIERQQIHAHAQASAASARPGPPGRRSRRLASSASFRANSLDGSYIGSESHRLVTWADVNPRQRATPFPVAEEARQ